MLFFRAVEITARRVPASPARRGLAARLGFDFLADAPAGPAPRRPFAGRYHKVLDTDSQEFGGNGHHWINEYQSEAVPAFHHKHSFRTPLLPLHGLLFRMVDGQR